MPQVKKSNIGRHTRQALRIKLKRRKAQEKMNFQNNIGIHFLAPKSILTEPAPHPVQIIKTESLISQYHSTTPLPKIKLEKSDFVTDSQYRYNFHNSNMNDSNETHSNHANESIPSTDTEKNLDTKNYPINSIFIESVIIKEEFNEESDDT